MGAKVPADKAGDAARSAFCLAAGLALAPGASAEVRLIDTTTGASRTILHDDPREPYTEEPHLVRFADDNAVLVRRRGRVLRVGIADRGAHRLPWLDRAEAVGPGGRSIHLRYREEPRVTLRAPDGRRIARYDFERSDIEPFVAWTKEGTRVAVARPPVLKVLDAATGAVVMDRRVSEDLEFSTSAWSPDGTALLVSEGARLLRIDVASGAAAERIAAAPTRRSQAIGARAAGSSSTTAGRCGCSTTSRSGSMPATSV